MIAQSPLKLPAAVLRVVSLVFMSAAAQTNAASIPAVEVTPTELESRGFPWQASSAAFREAALKGRVSRAGFTVLSRRRADAGLAVGAYGYSALSYRNLLRLDPVARSRPLITLGMGQSVLGQSFPQGARETFRRGSEDFLYSSVADELLFWKGEACWRTEDHVAAGEAFRSLLDRYPESPWRAEALYRLGWVLDRQGEYARAEERFLESAKLDRELKPSADLQRGWVLLKSGRASQAGEIFARVREEYPDTLAAREGLIGQAEVAYHEEDFAAARGLYDSALAQAENARERAAIMYGLAWTSLKQRRWEAARSRFLKVEKEYPAEPVAPFAAYRAALCLIDLGQPGEALSDLGDVQARYPRHDVGQWSAYSKGWIHLTRSRFNEAKAAFRALIEEFPDGMLTAPAKYLFATALYQERRFKEAGREFAAMAAEHATSGLADGALLWAGWASLLDGKPRDALRHLDELKRGFPDSEWLPDAAVGQGEASFALGDYLGARTAYREAARGAGAVRLKGLSGLGWCALADSNWKEAEKWFGKVFAEAPEGEVRLRARVRLADSLFNQKKYAAALKHYSPASTGNVGPLARWAQMQAGWCELRLEKPEGAQRQWEQLRRRWPKSDEALLALNAIGETQFNRELFGEAERSFRRLAREAKPGTETAETAAIRIGDCLYNAKAYEKAVLAYREFTKLHPKSKRLGEALHGMQWSYLQLGEYEKSRREASAFLEKYPRASLAPEVNLMVAESFQKEGKMSEAIRKYRDLVERYPDDELAVSARFKIGEAQRNGGDYPAAVATFEDFLSRYPDHSLAGEARFSLGVSRYGVGDVEKALTEFAAVSENQADPRAPKALYNILLCNKRLAREEGVVNALARLKERYPSSDAAWRARLSAAYFYVDAGRGKDAVPLLAEITSGSHLRVRAEAHCVLGDIYLEREDRALALKSYTAGSEDLPGGDDWSVQCAFSAANLLGSDGRDREAIDMFRKVLEKKSAASSQVADAYFGIGQRYEALGKPNQARLMYRKCLESKPGEELAARARARVKAIKDAQSQAAPVQPAPAAGSGGSQ